MADRDPYRRSEGERHPLRRLSSIGGTTSGWRSTLESGRQHSGGLGTFIIGTLIAGGVYALIMLVAALSAG